MSTKLGRAVTTGSMGVIGAMFGGFVGGEFGASRAFYARGNVRKVDVERGRADGTLLGSAIGALILGAVAGSSTTCSPEEPASGQLSSPRFP